jgi:hypothetical protein
MVSVKNRRKSTDPDIYSEERKENDDNEAKKSKTKKKNSHVKTVKMI